MAHESTQDAARDITQGITQDVTQDLLAEAFGELLREQCTSAVVRAVETEAQREGDSPAARALWQQIDDAGFADALVSEAQGGAGLGWGDCFSMMTLCGAHALPVPFASTLFARAWIARAGGTASHGSIALGVSVSAAVSVSVASGGTDVVCPNVPLGRVADAVLVWHAGVMRLLKVADASVSSADFALDATLTWTGPQAAAATHWTMATVSIPTAQDLRVVQACIHAAQLAGAALAVFERSLDYANDREQFGRPIGKFQAIQHQLSVMAEHAFAARMAAQIGCGGVGEGEVENMAPLIPDLLRVAVAKARTSEAALEVASLSHSIHGAMGFTEAFDLQLLTRRLHHWRQTAGSESYWHGVLGQALVARPEPLSLDLMRTVTDRSAVPV